MNKVSYISFLFFSLLLLQVLILNNVLFLDYINPYLYVAFVIFYPLKKERYLFLFLSFLLGLSIDFFSDSGGINAFSLLFIAYIRLFLVRIIFKKTEQDYLLFDLHQEPFGKVFNYVIILIVIHHFILFSLANFSTQNFSSVIANTLYSSIFTSVLFFLGTYIIRKKK
ncbi:rod shape-determining protein MreD [Polaribacter gochangensis]|uniref:rod shape-determining protein MreD n=1 Tax=Polaribacter gochangensis TaxID=3252903 RepID=UPI003904D875